MLAKKMPERDCKDTLAFVSFIIVFKIDAG